MPDTASPPPPARIELEPNGAAAKLDLRTIFLGGRRIIKKKTTCYAAAEILLPIVLALVMSLVLQPVLRVLERIGLPRVLAALAIILAFLSILVLIGMLLATPASDWLAQLPQTLPRLQQRLSFLAPPIRRLQGAFEHIQSLGAGNGPAPIPVQTATPISQRILSNLRSIAGGLFTMALLLFFLLIAGDRFLRRLVELLPSFREKRQAVDISQQIEHDISIYLATITIMNLLVGIATGLVMWGCGLGSPLLWGTIAFLLNYVPVLGPTAGVILFLITGLVTTDTVWGALLPPALYLLIHVCEGETITPMLLARRFTINPVLVILSLIFWYWMWGVPGAILSTPMLAIAKILCDRIEPLKPVGHFIEG